MSIELHELPWPLPVRDSRNGNVEYAPNVGKTSKRFRSMWAAQEYELGARARLRGYGLHGEASALTREGWCDMDEISKKSMPADLTFAGARA